uniref:DNA processing protein A n=1 Tax=Clandestinovirus TaxID=2831644 RepID=A0A8F8KSR8_9VIRU|nr:DNA processing protein A [Clandestinovirus]
MSQLKLVISGGQDGVDLGALLAARYMNIPTGGYMPKEFQTERGRNPLRAQEFNLKESSGSYKRRDMENVDMADGVVAFLVDRPMTGRGTTSTVRYAERGDHVFDPLVKPEDGNFLEISGPTAKKPCLVMWMPEMPPCDKGNAREIRRKALRDYHKPIAEFIVKHRIEKLMVSGFCASTYEEADQIIQNLFVNVFYYVYALNRRSALKDEPEKVNTE